YWYQNDHLGTPRELTSNAGNIEWEAVYQAWGNTVTVEWQEVAKAQEFEAIELNELEKAYLLQPHRFQGQIYDVETGLHYNRFRYYDPDAGRFVSHDPIGLLGGDNHFLYVPNPIEWVDPIGWMPWKWNPNGMGHHLIPRGKANSIGLDILGSTKDTPTFFPNPYKDSMHEALHQAIKNDIGKLQGPWKGTAAELFEASSRNLDSVAHIKGDLKIPRTGEILASNVTPKEAHRLLVEWYERNKNLGICDGK
ncbi:RHS repeat domain-containing protein, partial [Acinetobacter shaoyimingii]|uniref:RHS repeat domain-containing protein n=1 Tax=Acinetobacter shaoyimingii TaxID=2715164 RepID=UPI001D0F05C5